MKAALDRLRLFNFREFTAHWGRSVASVVVVAVSSALLVAVFGISGSITGSVNQLASSIAGNSDLEVAGVTAGGFDQSLLPAVKAVPDIAAAVPMLRTQLRTADDRILLIGVDASITALDSDLRDAVSGKLTPDLLAVHNGVVVGSGLGLAKGDTLTLGSETVTVAAVIDGEVVSRINGGHFVVAILPLAQRIADRQNQLDSILVVARSGADVAAVREGVTDAVDGRALVASTDFRAKQAADGVAVLSASTFLSASMALIVSCFLVYNAMNMAVVQRRPNLSTQRAIGGRRSVIVRDLLAEAALLGLLGAVFGVPLGVLMGRAAIGVLPPLLIQSFDARLDYFLPSYAIPVAVIACVVACVGASAAAARQVYRVAPIEALQPVGASTADKTNRWLAAVAGGGGLALCAVAMWVALSVDDNVALLAPALIFAGALGVCFALTQPIVALTSAVARRFGAAGALGATNIERAPRRVWATVVTALTVVAATVGLTGANENLLDSATEWFMPVTGADLWVATNPPSELPIGPALPAGLESTITAVPGVASVVPFRAAFAALGDRRVFVQGASPGSHGLVFSAASPDAQERLLRGEGVLLSRDVARTLNKHEGDVLDLPTAHGIKQVRILEVVEYLSLLNGALGLRLDQLREWFDLPGADNLEVQVAPGFERSQVENAILAVSPEAVEVYTGQEFLEGGTGSIRQASVLNNAMLLIVALVGAIALLNTLMLSVIERRREFGVLRALGSSRRFTSKMVLAEASAIGIVGGLLGIAVGLVVHYAAAASLVAVATIDVEYRIGPRIFVFAGAAVVLSMLGSIPPSVRAARLNIIEAVAAE
ncbi:ABC transporter permease [Antrihabitans stalactiti]|uniref:ABC transporter permease n=1 Tax=Antrihabitans stalactiti TaxID=2584121 RepID=UPI0030B81C34